MSAVEEWVCVWVQVLLIYHYYLLVGWQEGAHVQQVSVHVQGNFLDAAQRGLGVVEEAAKRGKAGAGRQEEVVRRNVAQWMVDVKKKKE
jgi:hypothetical protein